MTVNFSSTHSSHLFPSFLTFAVQLPTTLVKLLSISSSFYKVLQCVFLCSTYYLTFQWKDLVPLSLFISFAFETFVSVICVSVCRVHLSLSLSFFLCGDQCVIFTFLLTFTSKSSSLYHQCQCSLQVEQHRRLSTASNCRQHMPAGHLDVAAD